MAESFYAHWAKMKEWSLHDAISIFADYEVMQMGIDNSRHFYTLRESIYKRQANSFRQFFRENVDKLTKVAYLENAYDSEEDYNNGTPSIDLKASFANSSDIIKWAVTSNLKTPKEFLKEDGDADGSNDDTGEVPPMSADDEIDLDEKMLSDIDKAPVSWLKKKVKELTNEKDKWDKSIVIAAKIGLLFYEKGLGKPVTKVDFYESYNSVFNGIPKKTVEKIYQALPTEYRNIGERPANEAVDYSSIIKAAVYAGSIYDTNDAKSLKSLKKELVDNEYKLPSDDVLLKIIDAVKAV